MINKIKTLFIVICLFSLLSGCFQPGSPVSITVIPDFIEILVGDSSSLMVISLPAQSNAEVTWESADTSIITVDNTGTITGIKQGEARVMAYSVIDKNVFGSCLVRVKEKDSPVPNIDILLSPDALTLQINEEAGLTVMVMPAGISQEVTWVSGNPAIATVSNMGIVKGIAPGMTTITVRSVVNPARYAYCIVIVEEAGAVVSVEIQPSSATLKIGETVTLSAAISNSASQAVYWSSNNPTIAAVNTNGEVTGLLAGTAIISATAQLNSTAIGIAKITVIQDTEPVTPISISPSLIEIKEGESYQLEITTHPSVTRITWEADDKIVAVVDQTGKITGVKPGTTKIHAINADNITEKASCIVKVLSNYVDIKVSVKPASLTLDKNQTFQLEAKILPEEIDQSVTWESDNVATAIVDAFGVVTAKREGVTLIFARSTFDRRKTGFCVVTVTEKIVPVESIEVSPSDTEIFKGMKVQLSAKAFPAGADQRVTWGTTNSQIAVVDQSGEVTGLAAGTVFITAGALENPALMGSCIVTVIDPYKDLVVTLNYDAVSLSPGDIKILQATVTPGNIDNKNILWSSTDPNIATVDQSGKVTAIKDGLTVITAKSAANPKSIDTCVVNVNPKELILDTGFEDNCSEGDILWYSYTGATGCEYEISWLEAGSGSYTADITVSAYKADRTSPYFTSADAGPVVIKTDKCERVYLKVQKKDTAGTFRIKYSLSMAVAPETWTLMIYGNSNNLEECVIDNVKEMLAGYHANIGINVVLLLDKYTVYNYTLPVLGTAATGLYTIGVGTLNPIYNGKSYFNIANENTFEVNMGDAVVLRQFIEFSKNNFPAQKYGLIFIAHGQGIGGFSADDLVDADRLHPGEISAELTARHAVNLLGFNSCLMGNAEVAYQFRKDAGNPGFSSEIMLAPPSLTNEKGWNYKDTFLRISTVNGGTFTAEDETVTGNKEKIYAPAAMTAEELALVFVEEHRDGMFDYSLDFARGDSLNCFDLTKIKAVKETLDLLSASLYTNSTLSYESGTRVESGEMAALEVIRDNPDITIRYFRTNFPTAELKNKELTYYPYYDIKSFCEAITFDSRNFSFTTRTLAAGVVDCINNIILYSYYGEYESYNNLYGLTAFFSNGDLFYNDQEMFRYQWWYNANNTLNKPSDEKYFGEIAWCIDKGNDQVGQVDNWFELLDAWYDPAGNGVDGGSNGYQY